MTNRKIEALQEAAAQKAKNSAERVDKAIEKMIKQGQIISFKSVAQAANVSTAYLYKQENLRSRIEILRNQQKQQPKLKQVPLASDNSKNVIISTLREENKRLRNEINELRNINESLTGKLYKLQGANDLTERLKCENEKLAQEVRELQEKLASFESKLTQKVTPITKVSHKAKEIPESIQSKLESLEVKLNSTLTKVITTSSEQEVVAALLSVEQYIQQNDVNNICGLVVQAIREKWEPSVSLQKPTTSQNNIALIINTSSQINQDRETLSLEELAEISNIFIDNCND
jgi:chromosome segregation ATPase